MCSARSTCSVLRAAAYLVPSRLVCRGCEVLTTDDANVRCWCCGGPMADALGYCAPTAPPMSQRLALIANEVP